jgi:hypothetical protein
VVHLDNCSVHTSRVSTDWLEKTMFSAWHTSRIQLIWPLVTSTCFLQ